MFRQFFLGIPRDYDDAAMIDGCGRLRVFLHVILPQAKPAVWIVMRIFSFIATWNDYFGPLIYLLRPARSTHWHWISYAWQMPQPPQPQQPYNHIMAVADKLITLVPLTIFFFTQRYFVRALDREWYSGIRGHGVVAQR